MRFALAIVQYGSNPHVRCFEDMVIAMAAALRDLGHETAFSVIGRAGKANIQEAKIREMAEVVSGSKRVTNIDWKRVSSEPWTPIFFGGNNISSWPGATIPDNAIIFNTEQVSAIVDPRYFMQGCWSKFTIWDYAQSNIDALKRIGMRPVYCPIGYHPVMTRIEPAEEDIDVLFYGSVAGRRREMLDALDATGLRVAKITAARALYGRDLDAVIARAKVVINLHYYHRGVFEIFRVSQLLANRKCVVTENGGRDSELESFAQRACAYVDRAHFVEECRRLVADVTARREQAERGFEEFKKLSLTENVRQALEGS